MFTVFPSYRQAIFETPSSVMIVVIRNTYTEADGLLPGYAYLLSDGEAVSNTCKSRHCVDLRVPCTDETSMRVATADYRKGLPAYALTVNRLIK